MKRKSKTPRKPRKPQKPKQGTALKRWLWRIALLIFYTVFLYQLWIFSHVLYWNRHNTNNSAFMQSQLESLRENDPNATLQQAWVSYHQISYEMKRAIIVAEDSKFVRHNGFDYDALQSAFKKNIKEGKITAGGSTISQQLAKNLFLSSKQTMGRKLQEAIITVMMENVMSKQRILEIYLNVIEWGNGVFGVEAAAQHYFGLSALSLTQEQAAYLAAMVTNPRYYDNNRQSQHLLKKKEIFLGRLHSAKIP